MAAYAPTARSVTANPIAGTFKLLAFNDGVLEWAIYPPADGERNDDESAPQADIAEVAALDPPPATVNDLQSRLKWRRQRASNALRAWREQQNGHQDNDD